MEAAEKDGWRPVGDWGLKGWDFSEWPYNVYYRGDVDGRPAALNRCEGDLGVWVFDTAEHRDAYLDACAEWHWRHHPNRFGPEMAGVLDAHAPGELPDEYRGPFSWARLNDHEARTRPRPALPQPGETFRGGIVAAAADIGNDHAVLVVIDPRGDCTYVVLLLTVDEHGDWAGEPTSRHEHLTGAAEAFDELNS